MTALVLTVLGVLCLSTGVTVSQSSSPDNDECLCSCLKDVTPTTEEEKKQYVEEETKKITKELIVPKQNLSSVARRKESASDDRPSAENVGYIGVFLLCLSGAIIVVMDANYIIHMYNFFKDIFAK
ncbi:signal peptide, cub and egf-like domain-containing protein 1 [Plakobranchus ocellatus]|uniref:Signal peptide, cub and egf-like domain-containing protein 1 n=1 Tax=Plakobranchus ocellatus TaxID=259542 RepID=A0AAV3ZM87_9GAST|nr:signal peptide, cub and egf-like domain-containing protein 1 [Plakobranchus ocellatus]